MCVCTCVHSTKCLLFFVESTETLIARYSCATRYDPNRMCTIANKSSGAIDTIVILICTQKLNVSQFNLG